MFGSFQLTNPNSSFVPGVVNLVANPCQTFVALPMVTPLVFSGTWTTKQIIGEWGGLFSDPSAVPPPLFEVIQFAVAGSNPRGVRGSVIVTTESMVSYDAQICCGDCTPPPEPPCPENVTVAFERYACTSNQSTTALTNLTANQCLAPNVMMMPPPQGSANASNIPLPPPLVLPPVVRVSVSSSGFAPRDITARVGDSVLFVWIDGTHSVTAGTCAAPAPEVFHSGLFAAPHSFVLLIEEGMRNKLFRVYSRSDCSHTATITTI